MTICMTYFRIKFCSFVNVSCMIDVFLSRDEVLHDISWCYHFVLFNCMEFCQTLVFLINLEKCQEISVLSFIVFLVILE